MFHPEDYETLFGQNNSLYPSIEPSFLLAERIVVGIVCILSILGGLSVVFSFLCNSETACKCKEVYYHLCCGYKIQERDPDDETQIISKYPLKSYNCILVHLSIADIIVAGSHFWGLVMHLEERFAPNDTESRMMNNQSAIPAGFDISCTTQAAFTALSTFASFFWTDILAVFLAFNLIFEECSNNKLTGLNKTTAPEQIEVLDDDTAPNCCESPFFLHILFPLIGWGVPVVMVVAFAASNVLGYTESYDGGIKICMHLNIVLLSYMTLCIGWCFVYLDPNTMSLEQRHNLINYGYRFWLYGSVIIVLLCTISYSVYGCYKKIKVAMYSYM